MPTEHIVVDWSVERPQASKYQQRPRRGLPFLPRIGDMRIALEALHSKLQ